MIDEILDALCEAKKMTPEIFKALYPLKNIGLPEFTELTYNQFGYACYGLRLNVKKCIDRVNAIEINIELWGKGLCQRVAIIEELLSIMDFDGGELLPILIEPRAIYGYTRYGMEMHQKRKQWEFEYPGTDYYLNSINHDLESKTNWRV